MILSAIALSTVAEVEGRDTEVLNKWCVIRTRAERTEHEIFPVENVHPCFCIRSIGGLRGFAALKCAYLCLRIGDITADFRYQRLQRMGSAGEEEAARVSIRVDVCDRLFTKFLRMCFGPLSGADEPWFFAIPCAVH